jgi:hypothetical protein
VSSAAPQWSYADFAGHVRRFNQESVLDVVAASLALPRRLDEDSRRYTRTPPWALAAVVKASLCNGNPHRSMAMREKDLVLACHMHNNLHPEELDHAELGSPLAVIGPHWLRAVPVPGVDFEEMARAEAFFNGYVGRRPLTVITKDRLAAMLGAPVRDAPAWRCCCMSGRRRTVACLTPSGWTNRTSRRCSTCCRARRSST